LRAPGPVRCPAAARRAAFTLAEVAVTIALVGLALVWMLQALNTAKLTAAQTRNLKLARDLGLYTLGQIEAGLYVEDVTNDRLEGSYAELGYPDFFFEAVLGDQNFREQVRGVDGAFDNWRYEREERDDDEDQVEQPYEKVQIKVTFPKIQELTNELKLERWVAWVQVHPPEDDEQTAEEEP
jgi:hypothetical protein